MKFNFKRWLICFIVAALAITALSACGSNNGGPSSTNTQEKNVDEGDIIKIAEDGTIFSLQSDGITVIRTENGEPYVVDYLENEQTLIPLEMYLKGNRLITITGLLEDYYAGDYSEYRSAKHTQVLVNVYDISYLSNTERKQTPEANLIRHTVYNFKTPSCLVESRLTDDGSLYLFTTYDDVYSSSFDSDGNLKGYNRWDKKKITVDTTLTVDIHYVSYSERTGQYSGYTTDYLNKALYIEPTEATTRTNSVTGLFRISNMGATPAVTATNAVYGTDLSTVYMSENNVYPIFNAISVTRGCGRYETDNMIMTRFDKDLVMRAKKFHSATSAPSRYAFKEYDGILFATVQRSSVVYLASFTDKLEEIDSVRLCAGEDLKAVNYAVDGQGKTYAYAVTFRQTDPLYTVDITDPYDLTATSELEITGFSVYLHKFPPYYTVGIGYEATTSGQITGAKVTLFDTYYEQSAEINSLVIPNVDHAEILEDPRALYVHPTEIIFGFALRRYFEVEGTDRHIYKQGYYLFGVKEGRLVDIAYLSNFEGGIVGGDQAFYDYSTYRKTIRRATIIGEHLLTVSDGMIVSYPMASLNAGDKTPAYVLDTAISNIVLKNAPEQNIEREDGIFFEG